MSADIVKRHTTPPPAVFDSRGFRLNVGDRVGYQVHAGYVIYADVSATPALCATGFLTLVVTGRHPEVRDEGMVGQFIRVRGADLVKSHATRR